MSADQASQGVVKRSTAVLIILLAAVVGGVISLGTIMTGGEVLRQSETGVIMDSVSYTSPWGWLRVALVVAGCVLVALGCAAYDRGAGSAWLLLGLGMVAALAGLTLLLPLLIVTAYVVEQLRKRHGGAT